MTITSKQIFRAISHYQETNGVAKQIEERNVEFLIEAMRTGQDNNYVLIEDFMSKDMAVISQIMIVVLSPLSLI